MKMRKYMTEKIVEMKKNAHIAEIFGSFDSNLHTLEEAFGVKISDRSFGETPRSFRLRAKRMMYKKPSWR